MSDDHAREPEQLSRLFHRHANAGDVEGLVSLYEADAVLAVGKPVATGHEEIRRFYTELLQRKSSFPATEQPPALRQGDLALTFNTVPGKGLSVEVARRQPDGTWRLVIDQLKAG